MFRKHTRSLVFTAVVGVMSACGGPDAPLSSEAPEPTPPDVEQSAPDAEPEGDDADFEPVDLSDSDPVMQDPALATASIVSTEGAELEAVRLDADVESTESLSLVRLTPASGSVLSGVVAVGPELRPLSGVRLSEVRFALINEEGETVRTATQQNAPFCLTDDLNGVCRPWDVSALPAGRYTLEARTAIAGKPVIARSLLTLETNRPLPRDRFSLVASKNFSEAQLPADLRTWYGRFYRAMKSSRPRLNYTTAASSGDLFQLGRHLNPGLSDMMIALRVSGDPRIVAEMDRLMQLARAKLRDSNGDGYLNWRYLHEPGGPLYYGKDNHVMDEMLTHAAVAASAYVFQLNCPVDATYCERARFWKKYLREHFEPKWRKRNKVPTGPNFIDKNLVHPHMQWVRYNVYMHKLTGEASYLTEAKARVGEFQKLLREVSTPAGPAYVWGHGILELNGGMCQPTIYAGQTTRAVVDMALERFGMFADPAVMKRFAATASYMVIYKGTQEFSRDVCAEKDRYTPGRGTLRSDPHTGTDGKVADPILQKGFMSLPFTSLAAWDSTGRVVRTAEQVYAEFEPEDDNPRGIPVPAGLLLRNALR
jgi:hypothetical protein